MTSNIVKQKAIPARFSPTDLQVNNRVFRFVVLAYSLVENNDFMVLLLLPILQDAAEMQSISSATSSSYVTPRAPMYALSRLFKGERRLERRCKHPICRVHLNISATNYFVQFAPSDHLSLPARRYFTCNEENSNVNLGYLT